MRRPAAASGIMLICSSCVAAAVPPPAVTQLSMTTPPGNPACRDYTLQATVQGRPQTVVGHACQQPDGSWRVTEGVQGQPAQVVMTYAPPVYAYAPYYDPWAWGPPFGFSVGAFVVVDRHHHIHAMHGGGHAHAGMNHRVHGFGAGMHG